jgi:hypothetical protein
MAMNIGAEDEERIWLTHFTNNAAEIAAALARVPAFVNQPNTTAAEVQKSQKETPPKKDNGSLSIGVDTRKQGSQNQ